MRSPRVLLVTATVLLCLGNLIFSFLRSTIPIALDGTVDNVEFLTSKNRGIDDIYVLSVDGRHLHVDKDVAQQLDSNARVFKEAWSSDLTVGQGSSARTIELEPSADFEGMLVAMPVTALVITVLLLRKKRDVAGPQKRSANRETPV